MLARRLLGLALDTTQTLVPEVPPKVSRAGGPSLGTLRDKKTPRFSQGEATVLGPTEPAL